MSITVLKLWDTRVLLGGAGPTVSVPGPIFIILGLYNWEWAQELLFLLRGQWATPRRTLGERKGTSSFLSILIRPCCLPVLHLDTYSF